MFDKNHVFCQCVILINSPDSSDLPNFRIGLPMAIILPHFRVRSASCLTVPKFINMFSQIEINQVKISLK